MRPHLYYRDVLLLKLSIFPFIRNQNAALAITRAIRGTPKKKLYQELDFERLHSRK